MRIFLRSLWPIIGLLIIFAHGQGNASDSINGRRQAAVQPSSGGKDYPDGHGGFVHFPLGDISFADEVVSFYSGDPAASNPRDRNPKETLGPPNYDEKNDVNYCTLGCGGVLTLRFVDNALVDIPGPDLYVFEIGPDVEPTSLAISEDGTNWIEIGKIAGGRADIDIHEFVKPGQVFHFVRLVDLKSACGGSWPGADIDAVGAIGSILQFSLSSAVLFDFNKYTLKPEAKKELDSIVEQIVKWPGATIFIEGHTDSIGTPEKNQILSEKRAAAVRDYFRTTAIADFKMNVVGYGESRPVATNETEEGRAKNRRVEIIVVPASGAVR